MILRRNICFLHGTFVSQTEHSVSQTEHFVSHTEHLFPTRKIGFPRGAGPQEKVCRDVEHWGWKESTKFNKQIFDDFLKPPENFFTVWRFACSKHRCPFADGKYAESASIAPGFPKPTNNINEVEAMVVEYGVWQSIRCHLKDVACLLMANAIHARNNGCAFRMRTNKLQTASGRRILEWDPSVMSRNWSYHIFACEWKLTACYYWKTSISIW